MSQVLNLSVCIDAVFEGRAEEHAIDSVAACGFPAIEFWAWWEKDLDRIAQRTAHHGLAHCFDLYQVHQSGRP